MVAAAAVFVYRYDTKYFGRGDLQEFINSSWQTTPERWEQS